MAERPGPRSNVKPEILLISICKLSNQTKKDLQSFEKAETIIIHEEDKVERPSSPLPPAILKMYAHKEKPVLVHVRNGTESIPLKEMDNKWVHISVS